MKDKEKQIEEMARIIAFDLCPYGKLHAKLYENRARCASNDNFAECTKINNVVEKLYDKGYRNCKDKVVLSREDMRKYAKDCIAGQETGLDIINALIARGERYKEQAKQTSKETAEKILKEVAKTCGDYQWFKILCKQFGVDIGGSQ